MAPIGGKDTTSYLTAITMIALSLPVCEIFAKQEKAAKTLTYENEGQGQGVEQRYLLHWTEADIRAATSAGELSFVKNSVTSLCVIKCVGVNDIRYSPLNNCSSNLLPTWQLEVCGNDSTAHP